MYCEAEFHSDVLGGDGEFAVFLPAEPKAPVKVLWLLHGAFGEYSESIQNSSVVRYAEKRGMAVVAPSSYMGVYTDMVYGEKGYSFVKEVLEKAPALFRSLSKRREDNYVMGISMGGHGSFRLASEFPERFAGACAFSSPIEMVYTMELLENGKHGGGHELYDAFGSSEAYANTSGNVLAVFRSLKEKGVTIPRLALCWGDSEFAGHEDNRVKKAFDEMGIPLFTKIGHGGHSFDTWDPMLEEVLDYMMQEVTG